MTAKQYDVIISEPSNPWIAGVADLFTLEFFQLCHQRLNSRGIACIWLEGYHIDQESFRSVVRTFGSVFEDVSIWHTQSADYLLIGAKEKLAVDHQVLARRMSEQAIAADLERIDIKKVPDFLAYQVMGENGASRFSQGAPRHTDDNALLEFSTPRFLVTKDAQWAFYDAIEQHRESDLLFLTGAEHEAETLSAIKEETTRFVEAKRHIMRARSHIARDQQEQAFAEVRLATALNPSDTWLRKRDDGNLKKARKLVEQQQVAEAIDIYQFLLTLNPKHEQAHVLLAGLLCQQGNIEAALKHYRHGLSIDPNSIEALNDLAWILATHPNPAFRDVPQAIRLAEKACQLNGHQNANLMDTLSAAYAAADRFSDAHTIAKQALKLALAAGDLRLAEDLRSRIKLYEQQTPVRAPGPP